MGNFDTAEALIYSQVQDKEVQMAADRKHLTMQEALNLMQAGYKDHEPSDVCPMMIVPKFRNLWPDFLENCLALDSAFVEDKSEC